MSARPAGCQLDCQRNPVELTTNVRHKGRLLVGEVVPVSAGGGAVHKELHRGRGQRLGRCRSGLASRTVEGLKQIDVLTFDPQRFASGCDNVHERPFAEEMLSQHRYGLNHMLAAVEDQEDSLVGKEC
jgi:hypothetical protein